MAFAVMRVLYRYAVAKKELNQKAKLLIYRSIYAPTHMTKTMTSGIQAAKMSLLLVWAPS